MVIRQSLQGIVGDDRVIQDYNSVPEVPEKARMFKVHNQKRSRIVKALPLILKIAAVGVAGWYAGDKMFKYLENQPAEPSEQLEDKVSSEAYQTALYNLSKETYSVEESLKQQGLYHPLPAETMKSLKTAHEIPIIIGGRYAAFSQTNQNARFLDDNTPVPNLSSLVRAYSEKH